jgi:hypothetical protein
VRDLVGEDDLPADGAEAGEGLRVDEHPVARRVVVALAAAQLRRGHRRDARQVGRGAQQTRQLLGVVGDDDDHPFPPRPPGRRHPRHGGGCQPRDLVHERPLPRVPQDEHTGVADRDDRPAVPQGSGRGSALQGEVVVGGEQPPALAQDEGQVVVDDDRPLVEAVEGVAQRDLRRPPLPRP